MDIVKQLVSAVVNTVAVKFLEKEIIVFKTTFNKYSKNDQQLKTVSETGSIDFSQFVLSTTNPTLYSSWDIFLEDFLLLGSK